MIAKLVCQLLCSSKLQTYSYLKIHLVKNLIYCYKADHDDDDDSDVISIDSKENPSDDDIMLIPEKVFTPEKIGERKSSANSKQSINDQQIPTAENPLSKAVSPAQGDKVELNDEASSNLEQTGLEPAKVSEKSSISIAKSEHETDSATNTAELPVDNQFPDNHTIEDVVKSPLPNISERLGSPTKDTRSPSKCSAELLSDMFTAPDQAGVTNVNPLELENGAVKDSNNIPFASVDVKRSIDQERIKSLSSLSCKSKSQVSVKVESGPENSFSGCEISKEHRPFTCEELDKSVPQETISSPSDEIITIETGTDSPSSKEAESAEFADVIVLNDISASNDEKSDSALQQASAKLSTRENTKDSSDCDKSENVDLPLQDKLIDDDPEYQSKSPNSKNIGWIAKIDEKQKSKSYNLKLSPKLVSDTSTTRKQLHEVPKPKEGIKTSQKFTAKPPLAPTITKPTPNLISSGPISSNTSHGLRRGSILVADKLKEKNEDAKPEASTKRQFVFKVS